MERVSTSSVLRSSSTIALLLYAASRLVCSAWLAIALAVAPGKPGAPEIRAPKRTFLDLLTVWDGSWYRSIAANGYPTALPVDADGVVEQSAWAFLPVYAWVSGVLARTGIGFSAAAVIVSLLAGGAAVLVLLRILEPRVGRVRALWAVALFCAAPMSFVLQVGYAESLFLFLVLAALLAMQRRAYWVMLPFGVLAAFTRPGVLAVALALAVHGVLRLVRRGTVPLRDRVAIVTSGVVIAAAGLAWPVVAGLVTGRPDAYLQTELAWWRRSLGPIDHVVPFVQWLRIGKIHGGWIGVGVVAVLMVLAACWVLGRGSRRLGPDVVATSASYLLYLYGVFLPQQSLPRLLLPLAPMLGAPAIVGTRRRRVTALVVSVVLQPVAIWLLWATHHP